MPYSAAIDACCKCEDSSEVRIEDSHLPCVEEIGANPTATRWPFRFPVLAVVVMDASAHLPKYGDQFPFPVCILSCMASRMAASDAASSSCGLNITSSVPATAAGTCPGGM